jgi:flagellar motor switch protein FliM
MMNNTPEDDIIMTCVGTNMFTGRLGRMGNKIAVSINGAINRKSEEVK